MQIRSYSLKAVTTFMACLMIFVATAPRADAGMVGSQVGVASESTRAGDLASVRQSLEIKQVQGHLRELGYDPADVQARLDRLDDMQLHQLAMQIDEAQTAGSIGGVAVFLVIAVLVIGIIMFTYLGVGESMGQ